MGPAPDSRLATNLWARARRLARSPGLGLLQGRRRRAWRSANRRCRADLVPSLAARRRPVAGRACDHLAKRPPGPGSPPDDAALCNFRLPQMRAIKGISSGAAAWRETLALAVELDDVDYQLRAIWALWVDRGNNGQAGEALALADRFAVLAERAGDSQDRVIGQRMHGTSLHYMGDVVGSRRQSAHMLGRYA